MTHGASQILKMRYRECTQQLQIENRAEQKYQRHIQYYTIYRSQKLEKRNTDTI